MVKRTEHSYGTFNVKEFVKDTLTIADRKIPVRVGEIPHSELLFFVENPRIHSMIRRDGSEPSQEEIQAQLERMEHVKELISDIRRNGGLIDALVVRSGTREVIEGNSRLAAYRRLSDEDPIRWGKVKVQLLPEPVEALVVDVLLGQYHLKGKKEWPPYEQAGYLYRRVKHHGVDAAALATELGLSKLKVEKIVETYEFMVAHKDNQPERWSYYYEYTKSRKVAKARERFPQLDALIVEKIASGEIGRAADLRDKLPVICAASGKVLPRFVEEKVDFEEAYELAERRGGTHASYRRLEKFRKWLADTEIQERMASSPATVLDRIAFELNHLRKVVDRVAKRVQGKSS